MENKEESHKFNLFSNSINLDITPSGFNPLVTSTTVPVKSREEVIEQYLNVKNSPSKEVDFLSKKQQEDTSGQYDMDFFLDQLLAKNLKLTSNDVAKEIDIEASEGDFSKLTLIDFDATTDKLIDSDELPPEYLQPTVANGMDEFLQPYVAGNLNYENPLDNKLSTLSLSSDSFDFSEHLENKETQNYHNVADQSLVEPIKSQSLKESFNVFEIIGDKMNLGSLDVDEFKEIDFAELDEDEKNFIKQNEFGVEESFANKINPDFYSFSGHQEEVEVIPKASWMTSPVRRYLKPGNTIDIDDLLKARSCKLGALNDVFEEKPSFGMGSDHYQSALQNENQSSPLFMEENERSYLLKTFDCVDDLPAVELTAIEFVSQVAEGQVKENEENYNNPSHDEVGSQLEQTLNNFGGRLTAENMMKLCVMASKSTQPQAMLEKIMQIAHQQMDKTCSSSEIDTSLDILEMRKQKEAIKMEMDTIKRQNEARKLMMLKTVKQKLVNNNKAINKSDEPFQNNKDSAVSFLNTLPTEVSPTEQCIVGIGAKVDLDIYNPFRTVLHIKLNKIWETLNDLVLSSPVLSFKADYYIQPLCRSIITFHLCSRSSGTFCGLLEMSMKKDADSNYSTRPLKVSANVEIPVIDVICEDAMNVIDFGVIPESCCETKTVNIVNKSNIMFPITMSVEKFSWGKEKSSNFHSISANVVSCEIPADLNVLFNTLQYKADRLLDSSPLEIEDTLRIMLDRPLFTPLIIKEVPIKAVIGKISLRTTKAVTPLDIRGVAGQITVTELPLLNGSNFPLTLKLSINSDILSPSVPLIMMKSKEGCSAKIICRPIMQSPTIVQSKIVITVEPNGMVLEIPLVCVIEKPEPRRVLTSFQMEPVKMLKMDVSLECNRTSFVFGSVAIGEYSTQKLKLINRWTDDSLPLSLCVSGSNAFEIYDKDLSERVQSINIGPSDTVIVNIVFSPNHCNPYSATVIIKPSCVKEKIKFQLPIQGFGGKGNLLLNDWMESGSVNFGRISSGQTVRATTMAVNKGDRSIFVKMDIQNEIEGNIIVHPQSFVLCPQETRTVNVVLTVSPTFMSAERDYVGRLNAIFGDVILLRRFQRLKNRGINKRKLFDVDGSIIQCNWDNVMCDGEINEKDEFPSKIEDLTVFYKSCSKISVNLEAKIEESDRNCSSTLHPVLFEEETMSSMLNVGNINDKSPNPERHPSHGTDTFKIFPPIVRLSLDHLMEKVCVVSFMNEDLDIEVRNQEPWLLIDPQQTTIPKFSFITLSVKVARNAPYMRDKQTSIQVFSENKVQTMAVTISIGGPNRPGFAPSLPNSQGAPIVSTNELSRNKSNPQKILPSIKCGVEVPDKLDFPNTTTKTECVQKLQVKNSSSIYQEITANVECGTFLIKHQQFRIKPYTIVSLPIFFRPHQKGHHKSSLNINVVEENTKICVLLNGSAI